MPIDSFWRRVQDQPDQVFCHFITMAETRTVTMREMGRYAAAYANRFLEERIEQGTVLLIFLPHSLHLYAAYIGAMSVGLVPSFMPIPSSKQEPELYWSSHTSLMVRLGLPRIVSNTSTLDMMRKAGLPLGRAFNADEVNLCDVDPGSDLFSRRPVSRGQLALLQHSSGTTGLKKGVALTYGNIEDQLVVYSKRLALTLDDVIVSWLPLYHDMGLIACFMLPVNYGIPFIHMDAFHWLARPTIFLDAVKTYRATLAWLPNFAFDHLSNVVPERKVASYDLSSLRALINCSEPCRKPTFDRFTKRFAVAGLRTEVLQCCYAMAETVFAVSQTTPEASVRHRKFRRQTLDVGQFATLADEDDPDTIELMSCGLPMEYVDVRVQNDGNQVATDGFVGEIAVRGPFVFTGYFNNPELSAERLKEGWYYTRDLGFLFDRELYIIGRKDDVIICNGKNIYAHDVEAVLAGIHGIRPGRCIALSVSDERLGTQRLIIVAEREGEAVTDIAISVICKDIVSRVFTATGITPIVRLVAPGWLVKSTSGKIGRTENFRKFLLEFGGSKNDD